MKKKCVVVADGARARVLFYDPSSAPPRGTALTEREDLANPELQQPPHERFSQARSESRSHMGGQSYGFDDHRGAHDLEVERKFAVRVTERSCELAHELGVKELIVVADAKMLGFLRQAFDDHKSHKDLEVKTLSKEISKAPLAEIDAVLTKAGFLGA